jgi:hypothetical protein
MRMNQLFFGDNSRPPSSRPSIHTLTRPAVTLSRPTGEGMRRRNVRCVFGNISGGIGQTDWRENQGTQKLFLLLGEKVRMRASNQLT